MLTNTEVSAHKLHGCLSAVYTHLGDDAQYIHKVLFSLKELGGNMSASRVIRLVRRGGGSAAGGGRVHQGTQSIRRLFGSACAL